jgi:hypothetical protein
VTNICYLIAGALNTGNLNTSTKLHGTKSELTASTKKKIEIEEIIRLFTLMVPSLRLQNVVDVASYQTDGRDR